VPIASHPLCRFIPRSVCYGSTDPASRFCLRTLSFGSSTPIMGPILDTVVVSCIAIVGAMCKELGRHVNVGLLCPLLCLVRAHCFTSLVVTLRGYKSEWSPLRTLTSSYTIDRCLLVFLLVPRERERERERGYFWA
jgi:hypothetical protein